MAAAAAAQGCDRTSFPHAHMLPPNQREDFSLSQSLCISSISHNNGSNGGAGDRATLIEHRVQSLQSLAI